MILDAINRLSFDAEQTLYQFFPNKQQLSANHLRLKNGRKVRIQRLRENHVDDVYKIYRGLSKNSKRLRFCCEMSNVADDYFWNLAQATVGRCQTSGHGLIAFDAETGEPLAVSQYVETESASAEFSITVVDKMQGFGLGKSLTRKTIERAKKDGVRHLEAIVARDNFAMKLILMRSGYRFAQADYPTCVMLRLQLI